MTLSITSFVAVLALVGTGFGQTPTPQCVKTCQDAALSNGCAATAPCVCNGDYQNNMLNCLTKPAAQGGCSYNDIITWASTVQTQCFQSPPILPPCLTICPLQAQQAASCSSSTDKPCVCSQTYTSTATSCLQQACPQQLGDWQTTQTEQCGSSPSGSASPSQSGPVTGTQTTRSGTVIGSISTSIPGTSTASTTAGNSGSNSASSRFGGAKNTAMVTFLVGIIGSMMIAVAA